MYEPQHAPPPTTDAIVHAIDGLHAIDNAVRVALLERIVEYDRREAWSEDGACSMVDWLVFRYGYAVGTARMYVRVAHALVVLPCVRAAFCEGRLSWDKVVLITHVADPDSDERWAGEAEKMNVAQLEACVRARRRMSRIEAERRLSERYLRLRLVDDVLTVNGRLMGAEAAAVKLAIEHLADEQPKLPDGTYAPYEWRCADALVEMASSHLGELDRATIVMHIDHRELNHINGSASLEDGPSVIAETARRLACDGKIQLSVDDERGRPLQLGRTKRTVSAWLGRQIKTRDDHRCRFAGCTRTRGLQAHHITHWAHGGPTDDDNLLTLCWHHHRLVHEGGWRIRTDAEHNLRFIRPDGTTLSDRPTPLDPNVRRRMFGTSSRE